MPSLAAGRPVLDAERQPLTERLFAYVEQSHVTACTVLLLLALACVLPGFVSLQPMDRDEPRFAQASKQMLETGDFVDIRFQDEARHKKPIGIHWLQTATVAAAEAAGLRNARGIIAVYRVPSLLGALATVLLTYWAALAFCTRRQAFLAAAFMASCVVLMVEARLAKTDAVLAACSVLAMGALARAYLARGAVRLPAVTVALFWAAIAVGILIKGPMVVLFAGLAALVLSVRERSAAWLALLRPGVGIPVALAIVAPWFIAIAVKSGGAFFAGSVGHDMLGKVGGAQDQHGAPPGFYFLAFFATFWPAAALAAIAAPFAWANRRDDVFAFMFAWVVPAWLIFEAVPTKLPHYVLPLYPAIAIATVVAIARGGVVPDGLRARSTALLMPFIPIGVTIGLVAACWWLDHAIPYAGVPVLLAACAVSLAAWRLFLQGEVARAAMTNVVAAAILGVGVFGLTQPVLRSLKLSPRLAEAVRGVACANPAVATLGYREPSLVFLAGTGLDMLETADEAAGFLAAGGCRVALVERRFEDAFRAAIESSNLRPALATRVAGFNINGGRRVDIAAYVVSP